MRVHPATGRPPLVLQNPREVPIRRSATNPLLGVFGWTRRDNAGEPRAHWGVDFSIPLLAPVFAAHDGRIKVCGWQVGQGGKRENQGYGQRVSISGPDGIETIYGHMSLLVPYVTQMQVRAGDVLGMAGWSGNAEPWDAHLHFEVRLSGQPVNPLWWLGYTGESREGVPRP